MIYRKPNDRYQIRLIEKLRQRYYTGANAALAYDVEIKLLVMSYS
jgi:hypothetical protein